MRPAHIALYLLVGCLEAAIYLYADNLLVLLAAFPPPPFLAPLLRAARWLLQALFFSALGWQAVSLLLGAGGGLRSRASAPSRFAAAAAAAAPPPPHAHPASSPPLPGAAAAADPLAARLRAERARSLALRPRGAHFQLEPLRHTLHHPWERVMEALPRAAQPGAARAVGTPTSRAGPGGVAELHRVDTITFNLPPAVTSMGLPAEVELSDELLALPQARWARVTRKNVALRGFGELMVRWG